MEPLIKNPFVPKTILPKAYINIFPYRNLDSKINSKRDVLVNTNINNINKLASYFSSKGYTRPQIIGLLSNIIDESGGDPNRKQIGGSGIGLLQYTNSDRKDTFFKFSPDKKYDKDYFVTEDSDKELFRQAEYIHNELTGDKNTLTGLQHTH